MLRLILFRHGKAETTAPSGKDIDRALAARGETDARLIGEALFTAGYVPDLALVSAARRTRETWQAAQGVFPETRVEIVDALYNAGSGLILKLAMDADEPGTVMAVGHNPGLHEAAFRLAHSGEGDPAVMRGVGKGFPTAAAAVFRFEGGKPVAEAYFVPKDHGGGNEP